MSYAWDKISTLRGKFIPAQAWLLTSPETYRNLLHNQNKYINDVTSITIEGLYPKVAGKEMEASQENVSIKDYLLRKSQLIESMERTNNSSNRGKWFLS
eukprot:6293248-Ditylum_brightwellii.AAC.1